MNYMNASGKPDTLSMDELEAVERSGRSNWENYAHTPSEWTGALHHPVPLMKRRPGRTYPPEFPRTHKRWEPFELRLLRSDTKPGRLSATLQRPREEILLKRLALRSHSASWSQWEVELVLRYWHRPEKRNMVTAETKRTHAACTTMHYKLTRRRIK